MPAAHHSDAPDDGPLTCPKCRGPMAKGPVGDLTIDRCTSCGGLWFDAREKEKLLATPGVAAAVDVGPIRPTQPPAMGSLRCPRDGSDLIRMVDHTQPHIHFESCTVCGGSFFDWGELKDLGELTLRERLRAIFR